MTIKQYAFIKNNTVINIAVFDNPEEKTLLHFKEFHNLDLIIETNENSEVGGTYDGSKFWKIQPFPSWNKNQELNEWEPPIPYPIFDEENPKYYQWNEELLNWEEVSE